MADAPARRPWTWSGVSLAAAVVAIPVAAAWLGRDGQRIDELGRAILVVRSGAWTAVPLAAAGLAWIALVVRLAMTERGRRLVLRLTGAAMLPVVATVGAWCAAFDPFGRWWISDVPVTTPHGAYRQAAMWWITAIARDLDESWGRRTLLVVAEAPTDSPRRYAMVVLPEGRDETEGLALAPTGELVDHRDGRSYLVYDPAADRTFARETLAVVSPFLLLRADERGSEKSLRKAIGVLDAAREAGRRVVDGVVPDEDVLRAAIESPNPWVRDAAQRMADAGGPSLYPGLATR